MSPQALKLFVIVRQQLVNPEHPLNMVATEFVESYVDYYNRKIHQNIDEFYKTQAKEFQISRKDVKKAPLSPMNKLLTS